MPRFLSLLAFVCSIASSSIVLAQPRSFSSPIQGTDAVWMDAYMVGDSVLLTYLVYSANIEIKNAMWMTPDGTSKNIDLDTEIFSVNRYSNEVYYYVLEEIKKKLYLKAIIDRPDGTRIEPMEQILVEGDVLDQFIDKNQFVVLYDKKKGKLVEIELNRMQIVNKREWSIPPHMVEQSGKNPIQLVKTGSFFNSFLGTAKTKLYRNNEGQYMMTVDERNSTTKRPIPREKITGTHIAMLGDTTIQIIPFTKGSDEFRSWLVDGKLFRYSINRKFAALEVIDVATGKTMSDIIQQNGDPQFNVYRRDAVNKKIDQESTFKEMTSASPRSDPSVYAELDNDGNYLLTLGGKEALDPGVLHAGVAFGLTGIIIYTVVGGLQHAADTKGIERYYYSVFDPASGKLTSLSADIRTRFRDNIDRYEMAKGDLPAPRLQGYAENDRYVVGFYYRKGYLRRGENVEVVWFPR